VGWLQGVFWFFDNYLIPLAKMFRECEALWVDCDQLHYCATQKRIEWKRKGADIVKSWKEDFEGE
jgi:hypothetical protein